MIDRIQTNIALAQFTTFHTGGVASKLFTLTQEEEIFPVFRYALENNLPVHVIGGGSNVLINDGIVHALVLVIANKGIVFEKDGNEIYATVAAGENWDEFVSVCVGQKVWGVENLSAIPGTVGAAPVQNIGAYGVEVSSVIESVRVFDPKKNEIYDIDHGACSFAYRTSMFKKHPDLVVLAVRFHLSLKKNPQIGYADLKHWFCERRHMVPTILEIRDAVVAIRAKKFPDLSLYGTAGSYFKNPVISASEFSAIKKVYTNIAYWEISDGKIKISAAWMIEHIAKMKGVRVGDVGTWHKQALVIVNYGTATAQEIKRYARTIIECIKEKTGVVLEPEVVSIEGGPNKIH